MHFVLKWLAFPRAGRAWWPALMWMILIFGLSSVSGTEYPKVWYRDADKMVHVILYTPLGMLLARWIAGGLMPWRVVLTIAIGMAYGASDEWHQSFVPNRHASVADWIADSIGVVLGAIVWCALHAKLAEHAKPHIQVQQKQEST